MQESRAFAAKQIWQWERQRAARLSITNFILLYPIQLCVLTEWRQELQTRPLLATTVPSPRGPWHQHDARLLRNAASRVQTNHDIRAVSENGNWRYEVIFALTLEKQDVYSGMLNWLLVHVCPAMERLSSPTQPKEAGKVKVGNGKLIFVCVCVFASSCQGARETLRNRGINLLTCI